MVGITFDDYTVGDFDEEPESTGAGPSKPIMCSNSRDDIKT
jgi:hypothetical protein